MSIKQELDKYESVGTHQIVVHANGDNVTYFDSFGAEYSPKEIKQFKENKYIVTNIYRIQDNYSLICGYFCIGFIDFMLKGKCCKII